MEKETIKELIKELRKISKDIRIYNEIDFENLYIIPSTVEEWVCIYSFIYNYCFNG